MEEAARANISISVDNRYSRREGGCIVDGGTRTAQANLRGRARRARVRLRVGRRRGGRSSRSGSGRETRRGGC